MTIDEAIAQCDIRNYRKDVRWVPNPNEPVEFIPVYSVDSGQADISGPTDALLMLFMCGVSSVDGNDVIRTIRTRDYICNPVDIMVIKVESTTDKESSQGNIIWRRPTSV